MESKKRSILNVAVPREEIKFLERFGRQQGKTKSELAREALRIYRLNRELDEIQKYGQKLARRWGIETLEDVERIFG